MEGVVSQGESNVLYQPDIYRDQDQNMDDHMAETQSVSTVGAASFHTNYNRDIDPTILKAQQIRCCMCGVMMTPNASNTCINCLKSQIDITEGISKSLQLHHCKECNRYQKPPWVFCELESPELLALCLKNIKGLKRVKLVDAQFVWTEPHSRRIKVKVTVQKEVMNNTLLQQSFIVEFVVQNLQCDDCKKTYTPHTWVAQVQIRQRVEHKRTFLFLEQLIIRHNAAEKCLNIKEVYDGIDFQYKTKSHAARLVDFVQNQFPIRVKQSKTLISQDFKNNVCNYKYTYCVDLAPVCKEDLVILPKALSKELGGIGPLVLVYKISTFVHIVDVNTMQTYEIDQQAYWKHQFTAMCGRDRLKEFVVINIENTDFLDANVSRAAARQKFKQVQVEVARKEDFGANDKTFIVNTHLGEILNFNDTVLGYDLDAMNLADLEDYQHTNRTMPDIVLVKKTYPKLRKAQKNRIWKLKHLDKEALDENNIHKKKNQQKQGDRDYEMFLRDIEDEPEMRQQIALYRNEDVIGELERKIAQLDLEETVKKSPLQETLDKGQAKVGKEERKVAKGVRKTNQGKTKHLETEESRVKNQRLQKVNIKQKHEVDEEDYESPEEDAPAIKIEELLADLKIHDDKEAANNEDAEWEDEGDDEAFEEEPAQK